jgi:DNA-binding NtrC family response regulator
MNDGHQGNGLDASAPGAVAAPGQPDSPAAGAADVTERPARILILEDEAWDAERAQSLLTSAGLDFTCIVVATKALFVEKLDSFRPDVILSDYHLPGFSGEAALAIAQERYPDVPFIIWSGVLGDEAAVALIKQGATDYVLKDRPARLPSVIGRALAETEQRMRLADLDEQLREAQRLASLGYLGAAEQAMNLTRELLATARQEVTTTEPPSRLRRGSDRP